MRQIYYNGTVYTGELPLLEAFAVEDGRFLFAGTNEQAKEAAGSEDELIDLQGNFVCSGFNDSHMHLLGYGNLLRSANLSEHTKSLSDMIACLKEFSMAHPPKEGGWIIGRGWNQDYFDDVNRMPDRYDLDQVSKTVPVCAVRACGHCLVVNSRAIELLGITADTPQPDGGEIGLMDKTPDGRFFDNAMDLVNKALPAPDKDEIKEMLIQACHALNAYGVTSCQSDDFVAFKNVPWQMVIEAYKELEAEGKLTVRVNEQSHFTNVESFSAFLEAGYKTGVGSDMFKIGPLKAFGDGALGARTAYLSRPYEDEPSTHGLSLYTQEELDSLISFAHKNGMQAAIHTIGDACLDQVLHAYEKAMTEDPGRDLRHGIVHCQISRKDQLEKICRLGLHVYAQSIFLDYDIHIVKERVGEELASTSYSWKSLMEGGATVSNGTDCPVEMPNALAGIQCAVTRQNLDGTMPPYLPEQAFTVKEALDSYTKAGAYASFEESSKGQIAPGMAADFVVLGKNPFEVKPETIREIPVCAAYLAGKKVYG